ncbi:MAG: hypothetical protein JNL67_09460 [Planctomycetaceae bacterium]|nr:hypothetical protein [Planctomycetaceae bacterium]
MATTPETPKSRVSGRSPSSARPARAGVWLGVRRVTLLLAIFGGFWLFSRVPTLLDQMGFSLVPVAGWVELEGGVTESSRLVFVPLERNLEFDLQAISVATVKKNGRFVLETLDGKPGAVRGRHLVFLLPTPDPPPEGDDPVSSPKSTGSGEPGQEPKPDAWRNASDLLGFWVMPVPVKAEVSVPFFGTKSMRIEFKQSEQLNNQNDVSIRAIWGEGLERPVAELVDRAVFIMRTTDEHNS